MRERPALVAPTVATMRLLLRIAALLVFIIGVPLYLAPTRTETLFAWTIATPLTAAFLGGAYWSAGVLEWMASRRPDWSDARIAVPSVLIFTALTFVVTLVHLDRFHLGAEAAVTLAVTWAWLVVYAVVPVLLVLGLVLQGRAAGQDRPRTAPLPGLARAMFVAQGVVLAGTGLWLALAPAAAAPHWPWSLTPLTARAIGVWLLSLGIAALHAAQENDRVRIRPVTGGYAALAVLQVLALARFPGDFAWGTTAGWLYLLFLGWMFLQLLVLAATRRRG
jgi:hypothetical protein